MNSDKRVMIINEFVLDRDTRITKIIKMLKDNGYEVNLLCWDQGFKPPRSEKCEAGEFDREIRLKLKAQWGTAKYITLPIWWIFVFFWLMITKWDIAHAVQIISALPAVLAGKLKNKPVVYDMLDVYEDSLSIPIQFRNFLIMIDKIIMRSAAAVVLADKEEIEEVGGIPNPRVITVYDSPRTNHKVNSAHNDNDLFTLFFAGLLMKKKALNLDKIFRAIENLDGVRIIIAGYGDLVNDIEAWANMLPGKVQFIGEISHAEVLEKSAQADALFILRDPIVKVNKYICGSKILEAMMCGRPIIVNKGSSTSHIVSEENCGLVVDAHNIDEIKCAIIKLKENKDLCNRLGANGRDAYNIRYNWEIMEIRLLALYNELLLKYQ